MANNFAGVNKCVAVYNFEPGALTTDSKGSNTLTNLNSVASETSDYKQGSGCADFESSSQQAFTIPYASLPATWPMKGGTSNHRVAFTLWFKMESNTYNTLLSMDDSGLPGFSLVVDSGSIKLLSGNAVRATLFTGLSTGRWYHLGVSFDPSHGIGTFFTSYIARLWDDTAGSSSETIGDLADTIDYSNNLAFYIGGTGDGGSLKSDELWDGLIDEVVVFNKGIDYGEMQTIQLGEYDSTYWDYSNSNDFTIDPECVSVYDLENAANTVDTLGNNNFTVDGGATNDAVDYRSRAAAGVFNNDAYGRLDSELTSDFPFKTGNTDKDFSFTIWMKPTGGTANQYFLGKMDNFNNNQSFLLFWYGSGEYMSIRLNYTLIANNEFDFGTDIALNNWYHISFAINGSTNLVQTRIYCPDDDDDVQYRQWTFTNGPIAAGPGEFVFGGYYNGSWGGDFIGKFDELTIWKKPIAFSEMLSISLGTLGTIAYTYSSEFQIVLSLLTNSTQVDADSGECTSPPSGCKPVATITRQAYPLATMVQGDAPEASITKDDAPVATMTCRIIS